MQKQLEKEKQNKPDKIVYNANKEKMGMDNKFEKKLNKLEELLNKQQEEQNKAGDMDFIIIKTEIQPSHRSHQIDNNYKRSMNNMEELRDVMERKKNRSMGGKANKDGLLQLAEQPVL